MIEQSGPKKKFWTPTRLFFTVITLSSIAVIAFACNSREVNNAPDNTAKSNSNGPLKGPPDTTKLTPVPANAWNADLKDVDGKPIKLSEYAGKVLIVNLWATWCGPCRAETPELIQISKEYKARGVEVVGLTTQNNDSDIGLIKDFIREHEVPYRTIYDEGVLQPILSEATNARPIVPQSYIITRDSKILTHFEGFDPRSTPNKLRQYIELALSYKS